MWFNLRETPKKNRPFKINSDYQPAGDQPQAIKKLVSGLNDGEANQVLLGVTGSGKTFTMAKIIEQTQRPTLITAHNKTLAAQLYDEMKNFFPNNNVEYYVSFYDYYQPEAYVPKSDLYIEKTSDINKQIEQMRHSATRSILEYGDTIIVASVSSIYGIGDVESYSNMTINLEKNNEYEYSELLSQLIELQYSRNDFNFVRGTFRVHGDVIEIFPSHLENRAWRLDFFGEELEVIKEFDPLTGETFKELNQVFIYPNSHYVTPKPTVLQVLDDIRRETVRQASIFEIDGKFIEAQRIKERVAFDMEMLENTGYCNGIENYSRYLTGRKTGVAPPTLFEYLPKDSLLFVDESHVSIPQIRGMYNGDRARKTVLSEYGFRLPSCLDNRPLKFEEWNTIRPQTIFVSATPNEWEVSQSNNEVVQQIIRPTGLLDPVCEVRPVGTQVDDLLSELHTQAKNQERTLVTTLTKKMAEQLTEYLDENSIKVRYMHSDIDTLERTEIIRDLRLGVYDVLIGINLLREGLDIPECSLVAILDADKEGFLRSKTSLVQTIGRASRHVNGRVILYADKMTGSITEALSETNRRRKIQKEYNKKNNITPKATTRKISEILSNDKELPIKDNDKINVKSKDLNKVIKDLKIKMNKAAKDLNFEEAIRIRDLIDNIEKQNLGLKV